MWLLVLRGWMGSTLSLQSEVNMGQWFKPSHGHTLANQAEIKSVAALLSEETSTTVTKLVNRKVAGVKLCHSPTISTRYGTTFLCDVLERFHEQIPLCVTIYCTKSAKITGAHQSTVTDNIYSVDRIVSTVCGGKFSEIIFLERIDNFLFRTDAAIYNSIK